MKGNLNSKSMIVEGEMGYAELDMENYGRLGFGMRRQNSFRQYDHLT